MDAVGLVLPQPLGAAAILATSHSLPRILQAHQWQVAAVVMLKALSLERVPALRPAFETR